MNQTIVLVTSGKHDSTDYVCVEIFNSAQEAQAYIAEKTKLDTKYWVNAEIVHCGETVEL